MSVDVVQSFSSASLKRAGENASLTLTGITKCAEIYATDIGDRWTYFCAYCEKDTHDIGNIICHIRLDHLNAPQRQLLRQSQAAIGTKVNIFKPNASPPPLKKARESTSLPSAGISKCAEVFVTDIGDRWTYFCEYCEKATHDIGNIICHIRLDHLNAPQRQLLRRSKPSIEKGNVFTTIAPYTQSDPNLIEFMPTIQIAGVIPIGALSVTNAVEQSPPQEEIIAHNQKNVQIICSKVFNILNESTMVEPGKTATKEVAITPGANHSLDVFSQENSSYDKYENDNNRYQESYIKDSEFSNNNRNQNSGDNDTFGDKAFNISILTNNNEESSKNFDLNGSSLQVEKHSLIRNSSKVPLDTTSGENNMTTAIKRRREGFEKVDVVVKSELCQKVSRKKTNEAKENLDDYNTKMKEIDDEIAQYMMFHCELCNSESENFAGLKAHMREVHNIKQGYVRCCNKMINKRDCLLDHIYLHLHYNYYRCEDCDSTFVYRTSMRRHYKTQHEEYEDKMFECSVCSKKFVGKYLFEEHKIFGHRDSSTTCKSCNKSYNTLKELYDHAFKCHPLKHNDVKIHKLECDLCGSWLMDEEALVKHMKRHMEPKHVSELTCDICHRVFPHRTAMLRHKGYNHGTYRQHKCGICGKTFKMSTELKQHMAVHTGEVVINKCPYCPKTYTLYRSLHQHRQKLHPREYERDRKLRKRNVHLIKQPIPTTVLSNANEEIQDLLVNDSDQNKDSHDVLITTSTNDDFSNDATYSTKE